MTTVLVCGRCGRQAGKAAANLSTIVLDGSFRVGTTSRWWRSRAASPSFNTVDLDQPDDWPVRWDCPHCEARVVLARHDAHRIGTCPRLAVPPDSTP